LIQHRNFRRRGKKRRKIGIKKKKDVLVEKERGSRLERKMRGVPKRTETRKVIKRRRGG